MTTPLLSMARARLSDPAQRAVLVQMARFGFSGLIITLLFSLCYWIVAEKMGVDPMLANLLVFLVFSVISFVTHGRFSFEGHGERDRTHVRIMRFIVVNLIGLAANQAFVWVLVKKMHGPTWWPVLGFILVTPWLTFTLHRRWTYA